MDVNTRMRTLFDIGADLLALNNHAEDVADLDDPELQKQFEDWLASLRDEEGRKLDNYVGLVKTLELEAAACKAEAEQWQAKQHARARRAEWLKERMRLHLLATGRDKVTTEKGRVIAVQSNGGMLPVVIDELCEIPEEFLKVVKTVDKALVNLALESGAHLDFARFGQRGTHLRIR